MCNWPILSSTGKGHSLAHVGSDIQYWDLSDYRKAIQVREPYERLLSAYRFVFEYNDKNNDLKNIGNLNKILLRKYQYLPAAKVFLWTWDIKK